MVGIDLLEIDDYRGVDEPARWRGSGTRTRSLVEDAVDLFAEPLAVDRRRTGEPGDRRLRADELTLPNRCQLPDGNAVARDDERRAAVERA